MENKLPAMRIGHLRIVDHLILGISIERSSGEGTLSPPLEPMPMNTWEQVTNALVSGTVDGAFINTPLAMDLFGSGLALKFLMFVHRSGSLVVKSNTVAAVSGTGFSGFKGKSVLVPARVSVQALLFHRFLAGMGLNLGDPPQSEVKMEAAPPALMPHMLASDQEGDIGGCMVPEPFGTLAVALGKAKRICTSDSLWESHPCCGFVVNSNAVDRFGEGLQHIVTHFFESGALLQAEIIPNLISTAADFLGQDEKIVQKALWESGISFDPETLLPDARLLELMQTYMTSTMGTLPGPIDIDTFLDQRFAEKALTELTIEN